jgi:hypothetical protein
MTGQIIVHKNRTNIITVDLGTDVSADTFASQIRAGKSNDADLIATWTVSFLTNGTDGKLKLTIDNSLLTNVTRSNGYMDLKRIKNNEPLSVFEEPIEVIFREVITT